MQKQPKTLIKNTANLFNNAIVMIVLISVLFSTTINIISSVTKIELQVITKSSVYICLSYTLSSIALFSALAIYSFNNKKPLKTLFECEKPTTKSIIATLLITIGMIFGLSNVNNIIFEVAKNLGLNVTSPSLPQFSFISFVVILIFVCIMPPLLEEVIFRNILFKDFSKNGTILAIIITSIMFSLYHMSLTQTVYQLIVGVLFSLILLGGGNYILTAIAHFINNLFVVLNYYFFNITFSQELGVVVTILGLISLVLGIVLLFINNKKEIVKHQSGSIKEIIFSSILGLSICILFWVVGIF